LNSFRILLTLYVPLLLWQYLYVIHEDILDNVVEGFSPYFEGAKLKGISSDKELSDIATGEVVRKGLEEYERNSIRDGWPEDHRTWVDVYAFHFVKCLMKFNWDNILSKSFFGRDQTSHLSGISEEIDLGRYIERLDRAGVDNRLQHRRDVITNFLLSNEIKDYEEGLRMLHKIKRENQEWLEEEPVEGRSDRIARSRTEIIERTVSGLEFLIPVYVSDKRFIKRYLG